MSKHANFLNETETWKGLNEIKKRGKYLTACPEIENVHKRPKCNNIATLLINGNALPPVKIGNKHIMIENTCLFDATVQYIIGCYSKWSKYNKYIEQSCNSIFALIKSISMTGITSKIYYERAAIMQRVVSSKGNVLDCAMNVSFLTI